MRGKKKSYIYLAGSISQDPETYEWRERFTKALEPEIKDGAVVIVDPCGNKFNQSLKGFDGDSKAFIKEAVAKSKGLLMPKDYQMIKMCSLMVANIGLVGEKPLIGTLFELCWAEFEFHLPVIGIREKTRVNDYVLHSWINQCVDAWVFNEQEAADLVRYLFLEY